MLWCPSCQTEAPAGKRFCRLCGGALQNKPPPAEPPAFAFVRCPFCHSEIASEVKFCRHCGKRLTRQAPDVAAPTMPPIVEHSPEGEAQPTVQSLVLQTPGGHGRLTWLVLIAGAIGIAAVAALAYWFPRPRAVVQVAGARPESTKIAPEQIVDRGACPFEGCRYGEQWKVTQDVDVYVAPPDAVGVPVSSLHKKTVLHPGTWVITVTGIVLSKRHEGRIDLKLHPKIRAGVVRGPTLKDNEVISLYSYLGEGCWRSWIDGRFVVVCDVNSQGKPQNEWWIQIKMADGTKAWIDSAGKAFVSEERLNSELGERILDAKLALPDKLAEIDALLKNGAALNASGGKYGTDPLEAAIRTKDVDLLRALVSKGLNIRKSEPCSAYWAAQNALAPGGDQMLEFLLANGMQLSCLTEPPLHAFLRFGKATDSYATDRAIRIAEMLVRHGASVDQRDSQGKSILDLIDQANWASPVAPLRDALANLAKHQVAKTILDVSPEQTTHIDSARPSTDNNPDHPMSGAGFGGGAYRIGGGVSSPSVIFKVEPEYSEEARRAKLQGTVILFIVVDADGKPRDLKVIRPVGLGLDQKAIEAVKKWRFKPGMKDGNAVPVQCTIEVNFRLL